MEPVVGNMTVGASGADTRSVPEVNGLLQLFVNVIPHFVAGDAELLGIGDLHRPVETAPEDYAADTASDEHRAERKTRSWRPEEGPDTRNQSFPGSRCARIAHVYLAVVIDRCAKALRAPIFSYRDFRDQEQRMEIAEKMIGYVIGNAANANPIYFVEIGRKVMISVVCGILARNMCL
jgi:hypothetical protein